jgi:hypothetical protein
MTQIYFISGHIDLTDAEFNEHYLDKIKSAVDSGNKIITGDAKGADLMTQTFLTSLISTNPNIYDKICVYHMFKKPRNNVGNFKTKGGFKSDSERDSQMTRDSTHDILWMRPVEQQMKLLGEKYDPSHISGTQRNLLRRQKN